MGETLEQTQNRRFREQIGEFIDVKNASIKPEFNNQGILTNAKIKIFEPLNKLQLNSIIFLSDSWSQDISLKRSGAGIVIDFKLNQ